VNGYDGTFTECAVCDVGRVGSRERTWRGVLSLRDPAALNGTAGPPDEIAL